MPSTRARSFCRRRLRRRLRRSFLIRVAALGGVAALWPSLASPASAASGIWSAAGGGDWNVSGNWTGGVIAGGVGSTATFGSSITTATATINQNASSLTLGGVDFNNPHSCTISGNALTLDVASGNATLSAEQGSHTIACDVTLNDTLAYTGSGSAVVTMAGVISGTGGVVNTGGNMTFAGALANNYTGNTTVQAGALTIWKSVDALAFAPNTIVTVGTSAAGPVNATLAVHNPWPTGMSLVINGSGIFDNANSFANISNGLTMTGGSITNASLQVYNSNIVTNASSDPAVISSATGIGLLFADQTRSITVADGAAQLDLIINAPVSHGGFAKNGAGTMVLGGTQNAYTGPTFVNAGSLIIEHPLTTSSSLTVQATGRATLTQSGNDVIATNDVSILGSTCRLDIKDNKLILHNQAVGTWGGSFYSGVSLYIQSGYNNGTWDGGGIVTSMSAATGGNSLTSIGVASNAQLVYTTFAGQSVTSADTLVMYTYAGDANLEGAITGDDYFQIDSSFPQRLHGWYNGDFNYDGVINGDDYFLTDSNFPAQGPAFSTGAGVGPVAVPEPASIAPLSMVLLTAYLRRRRIQVPRP